MLQDALRKWQLFHKKRNKHSSQNKLFFYYLIVMLFKNRNGNVRGKYNILFQILILKINRENLQMQIKNRNNFK
jgi:hypothetical protein